MLPKKANSLAGIPTDVGILALEVYFPLRCINQMDLENYDNVSSGKYTVGLGQSILGFCGDREDVNSMCLTVVRRLMENFNIPYSSIGRIDVGTETLVDKSKSAKTHLMDLFGSHGNFDIEGVTSLNACYGATAALFNCIHWIESSYWDGRYALVVAADIAVYPAGPARPTSGAGAVAILIGPNASLVFERGLRSTHMENVYDFYKPILSSEYPVVDGVLSVSCFMRAVDMCTAGFLKRLDLIEPEYSPHLITESSDFTVFHSPYSKIVQKACTRLIYNDFVRSPYLNKFKNINLLLSNKDKSMKNESILDEKINYSSIIDDESDKKSQFSLTDKEIETYFQLNSKEFFSKSTEPSLWLCKNIGNTYCSSLYISLISLLTSIPDEELIGKSILLFSYGSGMAASMFRIRVVSSTNSVIKKEDIILRLNSRITCTPKYFEEVLTKRAMDSLKLSNKNEIPFDDLIISEEVKDTIWDKSYYLHSIDNKFRRSYKYNE